MAIHRYNALPKKLLPCICCYQNLDSAIALQDHMNEKHPNWAADIFKKIDVPQQVAQ